MFVIVGNKLVRVAPIITLTEEQRSQLQSYARGRKVPQRLVERASLILLAAESKQNWRSLKS